MIAAPSVCHLEGSDVRQPQLTGEPPALILAAAALSHPGRQRTENEDAFGSFVDGRLFVVADGMGGHNAGEVASAMAVDAIASFFRSHHNEPQQAWLYPVDRSLSLAANLLRNGIKVANDQIGGGRRRPDAHADGDHGRRDGLVGEERLAVAHAGDSRAYRFRAGNVEAADPRSLRRRRDARRAPRDDRR